MSKEKIKIAEDVAPNLVPMVDIMFLLLLFFMLSADMSNRELEEVVLPKAVSIKDDKASDTKKEKEESKRLTVNVYHNPKINCVEYDNKVDKDKLDRPICRNKEHWRVGIGGVDFTLPSGKERLQGRLDEEARLERKDPNNKMISERKVMIRVDALAPYGMAQQVMNLCAMVGIYKIEVGAAAPEDDRKKKGGH